MKKNLALLVTCCTIFFVSYSQNVKTPVNKNLLAFNGYLIHTYRLSANGYGYDIFKKGVVIKRQDINPYNNSVAGIKLREDALKTAKWQIMQIKPGKKMQPLAKEKLPVEVAHQLTINLN